MFSKKQECQHLWKPLITIEKQWRIKEVGEPFDEHRIHLIYNTEKTITWFYCEKCLISKKL
jgi:hypothetical protein